MEITITQGEIKQEDGTVPDALRGKMATLPGYVDIQTTDDGLTVACVDGYGYSAVHLRLIADLMEPTPYSIRMMPVDPANPPKCAECGADCSADAFISDDESRVICLRCALVTA